MSIKKDFQEYYWIMRDIDRLEEQLFIAETQATSSSQIISDMPRGGSVDKDKICGQVATIIEYQQTINIKLKDAYALKNKIELAITQLPAREQHLIRLRYIDRKSFEEIAVSMVYSWKQIHRIHASALKGLDVEKDVRECPKVL